MAGSTITQRIALEGADQIKQALAQIGKVGQEAFAQIQSAGENVKLDKPFGAVDAAAGRAGASIDTMRVRVSNASGAFGAARSTAQGLGDQVGNAFWAVNEHDALLNWVDPAQTLTKVGGANWTLGQGLKGVHPMTGSGRYKSGWNVGDGPHATTTSFCMFCKITAIDVPQDNMQPMGLFELSTPGPSAPDGSFLIVSITSDTGSGGGNVLPFNGNTGFPVGDGLGVWGTSRFYELRAHAIKFSADALGRTAQKDQCLGRHLDDVWSPTAVALFVRTFIGGLIGIEDRDRRPGALRDFILVPDGSFDSSELAGDLDEPHQDGFAFVHQLPCIRIKRTSASFSMRLLMRQVVPASASCPSTRSSNAMPADASAVRRTSAAGRIV